VLFCRAEADHDQAVALLEVVLGTHERCWWGVEARDDDIDLGGERRA
jgi:hypothetical protein